MVNVLANDGISKSGIDALTNMGFNISTTTVAQEQLINHINSQNIAVLDGFSFRSRLLDAASC